MDEDVIYIYTHTHTHTHTHTCIGMNLGKLQEMVRGREAWHSAVHVVTKSWTQLGDWKTAAILHNGILLSH